MIAYSVRMFGRLSLPEAIDVRVSFSYCTAGRAVVRKNSENSHTFGVVRLFEVELASTTFPEFAGKFAEIRMAATP
ncbi:hypothetical protein, partial [Nocardia beijingensis]